MKKEKISIPETNTQNAIWLNIDGGGVYHNL
jgi:hypothetical protein